jgi:hypothetical protein
MGGGPTTESLRPALELAWAVAKAGTKAHPPIAPPAGLEPLMSLTELTEQALTTIREVVEEDAEFRAKVAQWAQPAGIDGEPLWWLIGPGPAEELSRLRQANAQLTDELMAERAARRQIESQTQADRDVTVLADQIADQERTRLQERGRRWRAAYRRSRPTWGPPPTS